MDITDWQLSRKLFNYLKKGNIVWVEYVGIIYLHSQQIVLDHSKNVSVLFLELEDCSEVNIFRWKNKLLVLVRIVLYKE